MDNEVETIKSQRFTFILNRFKCKFLGSTYASQIHEESGDFEIIFKNFEEFRTLVRVKLETLFVNQAKSPDFCVKEGCKSLWNSLDDVNDDATMELFIINLINCSGITLKAFAKIFYKTFEYFYHNSKILRFKANEYVFLHKLEKDHDVLWQRKQFESRNQDHKSFLRRNNQNFKITSEIKNSDDFYKYYSSHKIKK